MLYFLFTISVYLPFCIHFDIKELHKLSKDCSLTVSATSRQWLWRSRWHRAFQRPRLSGLIRPIRHLRLVRSSTVSSLVGFKSRYWLHCHLNFRFSMTKIENLNHTIGKDINFVFLGKFITALVQKLKKNVNKLICSQYLDS